MRKKERENQKKTDSLTIFAEKGRLNDKIKNSLILENGIIHSENKSNEIQVIKFKKTELVFDDLKTKSIIYPKVQETSSKILLMPIVASLLTYGKDA